MGFKGVGKQPTNGSDGGMGSKELRKLYDVLWRPKLAEKIGKIEWWMHDGYCAERWVDEVINKYMVRVVGGGK